MNDGSKQASASPTQDEAQGALNAGSGQRGRTHPPGDLRVYLRGSPARGGMTEAVTEALRETILEGALRPGEWLREDHIAADLQVSRTPVREALHRLSDEGLVVKTAGQGTVVAPLSLEDVLAVYVVREQLEGLAARLAAGRCSDELIKDLADSQARMAVAVADGNPDACRGENLVFHRILRQVTGNPYLERFLTQTEHAVRRLPTTTFVAPDRPEAALAEHGEILDSISRRDGDGADAAARHHMRAARDLRITMVLDS